MNGRISRPKCVLRMKTHTRILMGLTVFLVSCLVLAGCSLREKPLQTATVPATVYQMQIDLPFPLEQSPKESQLPPGVNTYLSHMVTSSTRPTGEDLHLAEFSAAAFNVAKIEQDYGAAGTEKNAAFYTKVNQGLQTIYVKSLTTSAKAKNVSTSTEQMTVADRQATITTIQCQMKGEDETIKVVFIPDPQEDWIVALAYPKEKEDSTGKQVTKMIQSIKLTAVNK